MTTTTTPTDARLSVEDRARAVRLYMDTVVPFEDMSRPHKASAAPTPGATVHLIGDSVARVTIRATLSGIEIGAVDTRG